MNRLRDISSAYNIRFLYLLIAFCLAAVPAAAKIDVDFDPNLDFAKYKTFAFLGGVPNLVMLPADPGVVDDQVRAIVVRSLTKRGLREVQPNQNPDIVVRYWANASQQVNLANMGDWGRYAPYIGSDWAWTFHAVSASAGKEPTLIVDLLDSRAKTLAFRVYLTRKISSADKDWKKADEEMSKAFESFPPNDKEKEAKRRERAAHPANNG